jgi:hypothetical protein
MRIRCCPASAPPPAVTEVRYLPAPPPETPAPAGFVPEQTWLAR